MLTSVVVIPSPLTGFTLHPRCGRAGAGDLQPRHFIARNKRGVQARSREKPFEGYFRSIGSIGVETSGASCPPFDVGGCKKVKAPRSAPAGAAELRPAHDCPVISIRSLRVCVNEQSPPILLRVMMTNAEEY